MRMRVTRGLWSSTRKRRIDDRRRVTIFLHADGSRWISPSGISGADARMDVAGDLSHARMGGADYDFFDASAAGGSAGAACVGGGGGEGDDLSLACAGG